MTEAVKFEVPDGVPMQMYIDGNYVDATGG